MTLNPKALGLAFGVLGALSMFFLGLAATFFGWGTDLISLIGTVYIGYDASLVGSVMGGVWGFVEGFVCGFVAAWLYNKFARY